MKLSRTAAYAVQAALQLAEDDGRVPVPCSHLAATGHMPERFLLQILRQLVTHGVLHSTRGVDGGYVLGRKPGEISLLDIIEAVDGPLQAGCPPSNGLPSMSRAKLEKTMDNLVANARRELAAIRLADLLPPETANPRPRTRPWTP